MHEHDANAAARKVDLIGAILAVAIATFLSGLLSAGQGNNLSWYDFEWPPICKLVYYGWPLGPFVIGVIAWQFRRAVESESPARVRLLVNLGWLFAFGWATLTGVAWTTPWLIIGTKLN